MVPDRLDKCVVLSWEETALLFTTQGTTAEHIRKHMASPQQAYCLHCFLEACKAQPEKQVAASSAAESAGHEHARAVEEEPPS